MHGITQEHVDQYFQKYYDEDLWKIALDGKNLYTTGNVVIGDEMVPRAKLLASKFYKECLSRNENMVQLDGGIEALIDANRRKPNPKNRVEEAAESAVKAFALEQPGPGNDFVIEPFVLFQCICECIAHERTDVTEFRKIVGQPDQLVCQGWSFGGEMFTVDVLLRFV